MLPSIPERDVPQLSNPRQASQDTTILTLEERNDLPIGQVRTDPNSHDFRQHSQVVSPLTPKKYPRLGADRQTLSRVL